MKSRTFTLCVAVVLCTQLPAAAQQVSPTSSPGQTARAEFDRGYHDWQEGDYLTAIDRLERVLQLEHQGDNELMKSVARLTGEWFQTTEVAPDGTGPVWSPDGKHFAISVPTRATGPANGASLHVYEVRSSADGQLARPALRYRLSGRTPQFDDSGRDVYFLRVDKGERLEAERAQILQSIRATSRAEFARLREALAAADARFTSVHAIDLASGSERRIRSISAPVYWAAPAPGNTGLVTMRGHADGEPGYVFEHLDPSGSKRTVLSLASVASTPHITTRGDLVVEDGEVIHVASIAGGDGFAFPGSGAATSLDGLTIAAIQQADDQSHVVTLQRDSAQPEVVFSTTGAVDNVAVSPDGVHVVFQTMERENWELMTARTGIGEARRLTHEIQHDLYPRFLDGSTVFAVVGEGRHRRSYAYDIATGDRTRLFHNNTVRTVAPEYEWAVSPSGSQIIVVAERDGDTISPERGVYLMSLEHTVSRDDIAARLASMRASESALKDFANRTFGPIYGAVDAVTSEISTSRIYEYEKDLFAFGSKFITEPGNAQAITYLQETLRGFGYEPELQWFEPRPGVRTANVIATLRGTTDASLNYVISSHFDSVQRGPGADDNTSGTAALIEAARVLRSSPQSATIKFAFFTGEEAGLLGSREFVRRAVEAGDQIVGALNNDMVGFANDSRLDNTIRYSNDGIRDIQHAAAMSFSDLITYDARYYKNTDAHAYYEAYGDIVGGIGSYPILGNPHYHQRHDVLETINHQLVAEVSKTTVATVMLLASSPSRLRDFSIERRGRRTTATWALPLESGVTRYEVIYTPPGGTQRSVEAQTNTVTLTDAPAGTRVEVRAINGRRLKSWDALRGIVI